MNPIWEAPNRRTSPGRGSSPLERMREPRVGPHGTPTEHCNRARKSAIQAARREEIGSITRGDGVSRCSGSGSSENPAAESAAVGCDTAGSEGLIASARHFADLLLWGMTKRSGSGVAQRAIRRHDAKKKRPVRKDRAFAFRRPAYRNSSLAPHLSRRRG